MKPEDSLPYSPIATSGPYPEPNETCSKHPTLVPEETF
jgi:hypothetical protein